MADEAPTPRSETLASDNEHSQASIEATIESNALGGTESSCNNNNNNNAETSAAVSDPDREKSLDYADELFEKGSKAAKEHDYTEATECFSRALEIRVAHYGELSVECVNTYYKYGCALLYKAQEEADPLGAVPKKEGESQQESDKDGSVKNVIDRESSIASVSSKNDQDGKSNHEGGKLIDASGGKEQEEDDEGSDVDDLGEADEDESDLDLAWKMLDVARAIVEKHSGDTMEKVDILSALAEVALEREDVETSLSDYLKALSILERLVEPDSRHIAELNFRICLCLEIGSKAQEAIPYCQRAISVCKSRVQRLMDELKSLVGSTAAPAVSASDQTVQSSNGSQSDNPIAVKEAEIETLTGLSSELEKKLEDLQQLVSNPTSILSDILNMVAAKAKGGAEKTASSVAIGSSQMSIANSSGAFDSPTVSTAHTNGVAGVTDLGVVGRGAAGVTDLGVVGRGVKRVLMNSGKAESSPIKKPALDPSSDKGEGSAS